MYTYMYKHMYIQKYEYTYIYIYIYMFVLVEPHAPTRGRNNFSVGTTQHVTPQHTTNLTPHTQTISPSIPNMTIMRNATPLFSLKGITFSTSDHSDPSPKSKRSLPEIPRRVRQESTVRPKFGAKMNEGNRTHERRHFETGTERQSQRQTGHGSQPLFAESNASLAHARRSRTQHANSHMK